MPQAPKNTSPLYNAEASRKEADERKAGAMAPRTDTRTGKPLAPCGWDRVSEGTTWNPDCDCHACPSCSAKV